VVDRRFGLVSVFEGVVYIFYIEFVSDNSKIIASENNWSDQTRVEFYHVLILPVPILCGNFKQFENFSEKLIPEQTNEKN